MMQPDQGPASAGMMPPGGAPGAPGGAPGGGGPDPAALLALAQLNRKKKGGKGKGKRRHSKGGKVSRAAKKK